MSTFNLLTFNTLLNRPLLLHPSSLLSEATAATPDVVVIAQQLFSYRQLSRLRKSATAAGLSHRSCTVSCVGWIYT